jgi:amino acid transporter
MAKDSKFGTFAGVYTPSLLTILGVIMYLRLPWIIGNAGLYWGLGIILVAHVISVATGLSISSIATDKKVGAGGPYYIISRSLGLPIGGALGAALFFGLAFSISLYLIGFSASFLDYWGLEASKTSIRITGTVTLLAITALTFFSTSIAIKSQYVIMALIGVSLLAVFAGSPAPPVAPALEPAREAPPMAVLFGIFFPAVTGFTAGVNMSGDLRDARRAIPRGTLAAIGTGMVVYVGLALYAGLKIDRRLLIQDPNVLKQVAWFAPFVVAGVWGATLSSGLGCVLGAPRILQALGVDRIAPHWFARGYGKTNEPRNALVLAFLIGEAGILIAELDAIARIVSMVFLTMYGFLNLSCFIESWASPDFRPAFRIPKAVSLVGATTSVVVMILLDLPAMLGATGIMVALFVVLKRKQLSLDSGDTWEGVWSSLLRSGLYRLSQARQQRRNWRPNILLFREPASEPPPIRALGEALATGNGLLCDISLTTRKHAPLSRLGRAASPRLGIIERELVISGLHADILAATRFHGFGELTPNAVLLPIELVQQNPAAFLELAGQLGELDYNLFLFADGAQRGLRDHGRVDIWWRRDAGNLPLSLALLRFITRAHEWERATLRFLLVCADVGRQETLRSTLRRHLREARLEAAIRLVRADSDEEVAELIGAESHDAALVLLGLPEPLDGVATLESKLPHALLARLGPALVYRAGSAFEEVLDTVREASVSFLPPTGPDGERASNVPPLHLPEAPALARAARQQAERYHAWLTALHQDGFRPLYAANIQLVRRIRSVLERQWTATSRALESANAKKRRNLLNRAQSTILNECREALEQHLERTLSEQQDVLDGRIEALLADESLVDADGEPLVIERPRDDFGPSPQDSRWLRRFKRRRRMVSWISRRPPSYRIRLGPLQAYYRHRALAETVPAALAAWASDSDRLVARLGKLLHASRTNPALFGRDVDDEHLPRALSEHGQALVEQVTELEQKGKEHAQRAEWALLVAGRDLAAAFSQDADRLDFTVFVKRERRLPRDAARRSGESLRLRSSQWVEHQRALLERAIVGLRVSSFQHRLGTIAEREKQSLVVSLRSHALSECASLERRLEQASQDLARAGAIARELRPYLDLAAQFDAKGTIDRLFRDSTELLVDLPETLHTITDETLERLETGDPDVGDGETTELPLRRMVQYVVEADFIAGLQEVMASVAPAESRAIGVVHEVVRLATHHLGELAGADESMAPLLETQVASVLEHSRKRVAAESASLREQLARLEASVDTLLCQVVERTNTYELSRTASSLEQHLRLRQGKKAVFGARALLRRVATRVREGSVDLLYRRSAGQVLARRWQANAPGGRTHTDEIRQIVEAHSPKPEVYDSLPYYYRQLFLGQTAINDSFWVGRADSLSRARRAIQRMRQGATGAIFVVGDRSSGKTSLCDRVLSENGLKPLRVRAPLGGSSAIEDLDDALVKATGTADTTALLAGLPKQSAIVIDDLDLWWERTPTGLGVLERILDLVRTQSGRCPFLIAVSHHTFEFLNQLLPIRDHALAILRCDPLTAKDLERIITLRHNSTGLSFQFGGKLQADASTWALARLFTRHFDFSRGNVGAALRSWITHIDRFSDNVLCVRAPRPPTWDRLESLRPDWASLIVDLLLHKQMTLERLARVSARGQRDLVLDLDGLGRAGLVQEPRPNVYEVTPYLVHGVVESFRNRGLLQ